MKTLQVLSYVDLQPNLQVIRITVDIQGHINYGIETVLEIGVIDSDFPDSGLKLKTAYYSRTWNEALIGYEFPESVGVPLKPRRFKDNFHRLVLDTPENRQVVEGVYKSQSLRDYLLLIGEFEAAACSEKILKQGKQDYENLIRLSDEFDGYDDEEFLWSAKFMDYINTKRLD